MFSPVLCRADIPGGRFTPLKAEADRQTVIPAASTDTDAGTADVPAESGDLPKATFVQPSTAMYHSLALAGWGQLDNHKPYKALMFVTAEAVCLGGFAYLQYKLGEDNLSSLDKEQYRTDRNSFLLYWMIAKIYGIMDAYVDAHLASYDVTDITPEELDR